jgi:predicted O-linked N-acetylglucosamine transferase (SPINDLY family)
MPDPAAQTFALAWQHHQAGNLAQAVTLYKQILQANPAHYDAWCFLGGAYQAQGRLEDAEASFRRAFQLSPDHPSAGDCLGVVIATQGRLAEAGEIFEALLQYRPTDSQVYNNLGYLRYQQGRLAEAESHLRQAIRFRPNSAEAHNNLALALADQGKLDLALAHARRALEIRPEFAHAHNNVGHFLLKQGRPDLAHPSFKQALRYQPDLVTAQSNYLFCLNYDPQADPAFVFEEHRRWGQAAECRVRQFALSPASLTSHSALRTPHCPLRIGYVSADFRIHPLARYFEPILAHHDPSQVEAYCYAEVAVPDAVTRRLQNLAKGWRWTNGRSDEQVCEQIRNDQIDILVDLAGHTAGNRIGIFAHKPAPIQATWLGYLNTTGLTTVDYRLTDGILDPPDLAPLDTEELLRLPHGFCCFLPPTDAPAVSPLPALSRGYLTFGSLNSLFKVNPKVFDLWSRLLQALPSTRLLMFRDTLTGGAIDYIQGQFAERGISADRLDLRRGTNAQGYLGIYSEIDVGLDTFPFTGGVTTCESLWMGVPVLSLCGFRPAGRNSAALLASAGLEDWTVHNPQEYVDRGLKAANELEYLAALRAGLRERLKTTLCDAVRFARELEEAYRSMWQRWCTKSQL